MAEISLACRVIFDPTLEISAARAAAFGSLAGLLTIVFALYMKLRENDQ